MTDHHVLERFHRALIEEIQTQRPEYLIGPFTVAEIYQNLVPYASHRERIGVEMNADYEDALLRLLAGEGDYLALASEAAVRNLRSELETSNPNTGLYREYAAVDVRLNQGRMDLSGAAVGRVAELAVPASGSDNASEAERSGRAVSMTDLAPAVVSAASEDGPDEVTPPETLSAPAPGGLQPEFVEEGAPSAPPDCRECGSELPRRDGVNFCPFCGTDLSLVPCADCGADVERGWSFCASCGTRVD